jgi:hypothetical protein
MDRIPENKRPQINPELLAWYEKTYPGWSLALCCFDNKDKKKAEPLFWWYKPIDPKNLFFPAVDSHDGNPPDLTKKVPADHIILLGSDLFEPTPEKKDKNIDPYSFYSLLGEHYPPRPIPLWAGYKNALPEASWQFLPTKIMGHTFNRPLFAHFGGMPNGDFTIPVSELRKHNIYALDRVSP